MQLMPATVATLGVTDPFDPVQNVTAGCKLLASLYRQFKAWPEALASYNWGSANVKKHPNFAQWPAETRDYVTKVMQDWGYTNANPFGAPCWSRLW
jgi:soluble lytic murein transglycosylase-like protein